MYIYMHVRYIPHDVTHTLFPLCRNSSMWLWRSRWFEGLLWQNFCKNTWASSMFSCMRWSLGWGQIHVVEQCIYVYTCTCTVCIKNCISSKINTTEMLLHLKKEHSSHGVKTLYSMTHTFRCNCVNCNSTITKVRESSRHWNVTVARW